ncbi:MAG: hypothetical protein ACOC5K_00350 [Chloroflexota bacterium]
MSLNFERGNAESPRGHALVYFRDTSNPGAVAATYLILLPVEVDLQKYVPPFLAGQMPGGQDMDLSAFAFPPAPERVESKEWIEHTAEARDDDLLFGGNVRLDDATNMMTVIGEILSEYVERYGARVSAGGAVEASAGEEEAAALSEETVDDVMYAMMGEADRLNELTKLTGRLRYAVEGRDQDTANETLARMRAVAIHMPENRQVSRLIETAQDPSERGGRLAQLFLDRAYAMYREDYMRVQAIDDKIRAEGEQPPELPGPDQ